MKKNPNILSIFSLDKSLLNFRGDLIAALLGNNIAVCFAAPQSEGDTRRVPEESV